MWECLSASVEREAGASITSCSVNSKLDTEGSCLKTEEPKVLTLDTEKEKLTPERIKVRLLGNFSIDLYFRGLPLTVIPVLNCTCALL